MYLYSGRLYSSVNTAQYSTGTQLHRLCLCMCVRGRQRYMHDEDIVFLYNRSLSVVQLLAYWLCHTNVLCAGHRVQSVLPRGACCPPSCSHSHGPLFTHNDVILITSGISAPPSTPPRLTSFTSLICQFSSTSCSVPMATNCSSYATLSWLLTFFLWPILTCLWLMD